MHLPTEYGKFEIVFTKLFPKKGVRVNFRNFGLNFRYGFREPPEMDLSLKAYFGGNSLGKYERTVSTVMKHLESRLKIEFVKVLVCPNMDDEVLPFLHHIPYSLTEKNSNEKPTSIYVPKIKSSQSLQNVGKSPSQSTNNAAAANALPTPSSTSGSNFNCQN